MVLLSNNSSFPVAAQKEEHSQKEGVGAGNRYPAVSVYTTCQLMDRN